MGIEDQEEAVSEETNGVSEEITRGGIISATETTVGVPVDERAKILEDVRKLQQQATGEHPTPPKPKKKTPAEPPPAAEPEEEETELSALLKEREQKAAPKVEAKDADEWAKKVQALARMEAETLSQKQAIELERQKFELLKQDPARGLRSLGVDPMEWAQKLAGTVKPDNPEFAAIKAELAELKQALGGVTKKSTELDEYKGQLERQLSDFQIQRENENLMKALEAEKADKEVKYAFLGNSDAVVDRARALTSLYIEKTGKNTCEYPLLVKQLRHEARTKLSELAKDDDFYELLTTLRQKAGAGQGKAAPGKKPVAPSARAASERRATPKPIDEMTQDEQVEVMRQAARDATAGMSKPG